MTITEYTSSAKETGVYIKIQFMDDEVNHMYTSKMLLQMYMTHEEAISDIQLFMNTDGDNGNPSVFKCVNYNSEDNLSDKYLELSDDYYLYRPAQENQKIIFTDKPFLIEDNNTKTIHHKITWMSNSCTPEHIRSYLFLENGLVLYREKVFVSNFHFKNEVIREEMKNILQIYNKSE